MRTIITADTVTHELPCGHDAGTLDLSRPCAAGSVSHPLGDECDLCAAPMECCGRSPDDLHTEDCPVALALDALDY